MFQCVLELLVMIDLKTQQHFPSIILLTLIDYGCECECELLWVCGSQMAVFLPPNTTSSSCGLTCYKNFLLPPFLSHYFVLTSYYYQYYYYYYEVLVGRYIWINNELTIMITKCISIELVVVVLKMFQ